ncbi:winged helix-turn-helix domain-containing protein [Plantactinospora siamensis]|uniref:Winged helix-turn-helix domain-containing protein n=1 Tax=Plantactinospora siamensis TaxID=555372 RepID=A0ABV6P3U0_9ACTN
MIVLRPDAGTLGRMRLAPSPAYEVAWWIRQTARGGRHPFFGDLGAAARFALRDRDVALVARAIGGAGYIPDLLTPAPTGAAWTRAWAEQLEQVGQAGAELAAWHLAGHRAAGTPMPTDLRRTVDEGSFGRRAADGLRRFYDMVISPRHEYLSGVTAADLAYRGQVFAGHGLEHVLGTLHPGLRWTGAELHLALPYDVDADLAGADLVLVPSILHRDIAVQLDDSGRVYIAYPARGLNAAQDRRPVRGLPDLVGSTRAAILRDLDVPRTTTELSRRHTVAKSTVSHHLGILRKTGLIARARDGAVVRYGRTEQGDRIAAAS